mmetsp:Transcript_30230/g.39855  ORF Transcript_30230/g.39855 Transcript_30230/m.39855 type:complete len:367 (-) Transcript_30230:210-1310(-)
MDTLIDLTQAESNTPRTENEQIDENLMWPKDEFIELTPSELDKLIAERSTSDADQPTPIPVSENEKDNSIYALNPKKKRRIRETNYDDWQQALQIGDEVDARLEGCDWFESIVLNKANGKVRVHFKGWSSQWDQTLSLEPDKVQPAYSRTKDWRNTLRVGDLVELKTSADDEGDWIEAEVKSVREGCEKMVFTKAIFTNYSQWLDSQSESICLMGTHIPIRKMIFKRLEEQNQLEMQMMALQNSKAEQQLENDQLKITIKELQDKNIFDYISQGVDKQKLQAAEDAKLIGWESDLEKLLFDIRKIKDERSKQRLESLNCCVCWEARKSVLVFPCRHLCLCDNCEIQLEKCPICRTAISHTENNIYL